MDKIINYIIDNNILALALVGAIFAVLTTLLLIITVASNSSTKKQLRLISRSLINNQRPKVVPKFNTIEGNIKCLTFENIGGGYAKSIKIELNKEWLDAKTRLTDFESNNKVLNNLENYTFFLSANDSLSYGLFRADTESYEAEVLRNQELKVIVNYLDCNDVPFKDLFVLELASHEGTVTAQQTELMRILRDGVEKLDALKPAISKIEPTLAKIEPALSNMGLAVSTIEPQLRNITSVSREMDAKLAGFMEMNKDSVFNSLRIADATEEIVKVSKKNKAPIKRKVVPNNDVVPTKIKKRGRGRPPKNPQ